MQNYVWDGHRSSLHSRSKCTSEERTGGSTSYVKCGAGIENGKRGNASMGEGLKRSMHGKLEGGVNEKQKTFDQVDATMAHRSREKVEEEAETEAA